MDVGAWQRGVIIQIILEMNNGNLRTGLDISLQALSKRIHYGKFVAEAKFQASPDAYEAAIKAQVKKSIFLYSLAVMNYGGAGGFDMQWDGGVGFAG